MADEKERESVRRVVDAVFSSGLVDRKATMEDVVKKFGSDIDQVAGYVAAWDRYVLVVAKSAANEVLIRQS
ncbi:MAG: hypothetical protein HYX37_02835 [Rhizobiales bacterium]|jgi:hypothetical protein|nr:hypothetical protein [Hyphomicrobiales bacterium]